MVGGPLSIIVITATGPRFILSWNSVDRRVSGVPAHGSM
jgi:hypothetical protein